jgi:hypothetical protein
MNNLEEEIVIVMHSKFRRENIRKRNSPFSRDVLLITFMNHSIRRYWRVEP